MQFETRSKEYSPNKTQNVNPKLEELGIQNRSKINKIKVRLTKLDVMELKLASKNRTHQNPKVIATKMERVEFKIAPKNTYSTKIKVRATNWRDGIEIRSKKRHSKQPKPQPTNSKGMEFKFALQRASPNKTQNRSTNCRGVDFKNRNRALTNITQENPSASHKLEGIKLLVLTSGFELGWRLRQKRVVPEEWRPLLCHQDSS